jgi:hypothetical protein
MIEAIGLKITASRSPLMALTPTKFHENLSNTSEVISVGHTDKLVIW